MQSLYRTFKKCRFLLEGNVIGDSDYIVENAKIISEILEYKSNKRGLLLHQGTNIPLYLAVILSTFNSFLSDNSTSDAFLDELEYGDLVIYEDKRGEFQGFDSNGRVIVKSIVRNNPLMNFVPRALSYKLKPYRGNAKTLDGRGLKKGSLATNKLLSSIFEIPKNEINNSIKKSVVVICDRQEADTFIESLQIGINDENTKGFGEIFPAAFFTSNDVNYYPGNSARTEPIIKFTNKLSTARELIMDDRNITCMLIHRSEYISTESSELVSLYMRRSLKSIILIDEIYSKDFSAFKEHYENIEFYIWTQKIIQEKITDIGNINNDQCYENERLYKMLNNYLRKEVNVSDINCEIDSAKFFDCKKALFRISRSEILSSDKDLFIVRGFSLLNLFERACFPIFVMENLISDGQINALSPTTELINLEKITHQYSGDLGDDMLKVLTILIKMKDSLYHQNPKFEYIKEIIQERLALGEKIAFIVPKTYYKHIILDSLPKLYMKNILEHHDFFTPKKFNSATMYDEIIFVGVFDWEKLQPLELSNSRKIKILCYGNERTLFTHAQKKHSRKIDFYESRNSIKSNVLEDFIETKRTVTDDWNEDDSLTSELDLYTRKYAADSAIYSYSIDTTGTQSAEIAKIAYLETGECIFFTKNYIPYVLDFERQTALESDVFSISSGDMLIFTNFDNGTKDIVEKTMNDFLNVTSDDYFKEAFRKSIHWKSVLKNHIDLNNLTFKEVARNMQEIGKGKHEVTLRTWLDNDSHIVGPRDSDSFYAIALLTNDSEMLLDPDSFCESCRQVRSMRIRILKFIGASIIKAYNKEMVATDELFTMNPDEIRKMSTLVQIDRVMVPEKLSVPVHMTNKPQSIQ